MNKINSFSMRWIDLFEIINRLKLSVSYREDFVNAAYGNLHFKVTPDGDCIVTSLDGYRQASVMTRCPNKTAPGQILDFMIPVFKVPKVPKDSDSFVKVTVMSDLVRFHFQTTSKGSPPIIGWIPRINAKPFDYSLAFPKSKPASQILVNPNYLLDALKEVMGKRNDAEPIVINYYGPLSPLIITNSSAPHIEAMVLPVRDLSQFGERSVEVIDVVQELLGV